MPIVENDVMLEFDKKPRPDYKPYTNFSTMHFMLEFDEIEDFIIEIRERLHEAHIVDCAINVQ